MPGNTHFLTVWNPAYASDAMEASVELLLDHAGRFRSGEEGEDDVYVWWGKVRSSNRQEPLPHLDQILAVDGELSGEAGAVREVHLYLTDYQSLYVGHVAEITADDIRRDDTEHVPAFYIEQEFSCDCWFRLFDLRRVVTSDTPAVIDELRKLRNTRYHDRPVSIYGGMHELPLIVTRPDGGRFFDPDVRDLLTNGRFWVEHDAERAGVGRMEQELRENLLGEEAWRGLAPLSRGFIATAESVFRAHRDDLAFDFTPVVVDLAKAVEVQVNLLLRRALASAPPRDRLANVGGSTVDVASGSHFTLGELARIIGEEERANTALKGRLRDPAWFTASLPPILRDLADLRNAAAHRDRAARDAVTALRNRMLGVGCRGHLVELGRMQIR